MNTTLVVLEFITATGTVRRMVVKEGQTVREVAALGQRVFRPTKIRRIA